MRPGRYALRHGERALEVTVTADGRVEIDGVRWDARRLPSSGWLVSSGGEQHLVHAHADGDSVWVHADGVVHVLEVGPSGGGRVRARDGHAADLTAPMPAVVRAVLVAAGDAVATGDVLVMLEAMKMELPVRAPRAATVAKVRCVTGELVQPGVPLVELE